MSKSVIADFMGDFVVEGASEPSRGRVLLNRNRLVLAEGEDARTLIPLSAVFDVRAGHVPPDLAEFFNDSVTVAYRQRGRRQVAIIEEDGDTIDKFVNVLFQALLHEAQVLAVHPSRVGGRVVDTDPTPTVLDLRDATLGFKGSNELTVDLMTVSDIDRGTREVDGQSQPALSVQHVQDGQSIRSVLVMGAERQLNLLGRYLRREYTDVQEAVADVDLSAEQLEALVALYSAGGSADLTTVLGDPSRTNIVLNSLTDAGLAADGPDGTKITPKGRVAVNTHIEEVN